MKAHVLLEYAWYSEIRLSFVESSQRYILPYKIYINTEEEKQEDDWEGQLNELKKHTVTSVTPIKMSVEILSKINGNIGMNVSNLKNQFNSINNVVKQLKDDNDLIVK